MNEISHSRAIWLEDLRLSEPIDCGTFRLTEAEIIDFARRYDPQPFHMDPQQARASEFGGVIASSAQSLAVSCGLMVRAIKAVCVICGLSWDDIKLHRPVRPDLLFAVRAEWRAARPSRSKPDRGIAKIGIEIFEQSQIAMTYGITYMVRRRPPDANQVETGPALPCRRM